MKLVSHRSRKNTKIGNDKTETDALIVNQYPIRPKIVTHNLSMIRDDTHERGNEKSLFARCADS